MNALFKLLIASQRIDRRYLYLLLVVVLSAPFIFPISVPPPETSEQTQSFYDTIEQMANDPARRNKLVIVSVDFDAGTKAENQTQAEAVLRHLMQKKLHFAIFNFTSAPGTHIAQSFMDANAAKYGYVYGRDYVNWGYRPSAAIVPLLKSAIHDVPGTLKNDINDAPLAGMPVMNGIQTVDDIGLIVEITASESLPTWLQYFQRAGKDPIPTLYCPTRVMAPQAFPLLKSGQIQGMLSGLNGTIEYEGLIHESGFATKASASLSYSNMLIMLLIILGNVGMVLSNRAARDAEGGR